MRGRIGAVIVALGASALVAAGLGVAGTSKTYKVSAPLNAKQEVPKQVVKAPKATGSFTGSYVEHGRSATLTWKLTYTHLTGRATAAHIHLGKRGVFGNVIVPLCATNCRSGLTGKSTLTARIVAQIEAGKTYVNIHTKKNPNGEIRGQVKVKG
jgi:CHRD domain-containing protein